MGRAGCRCCRFACKLEVIDEMDPEFGVRMSIRVDIETVDAIPCMVFDIGEQNGPSFNELPQWLRSRRSRANRRIVPSSSKLFHGYPQRCCCVVN